MARSWRILVVAAAVFVGTWLWVALAGADPVAMHFNGSGDVDRWGPRSEFLASSGLGALGMTALLLGFGLSVSRIPRRFINTPKPSVWLSDRHRPEFDALIRDLMIRIAALVLILFAGINTVAVLARFHSAILTPVTIGFVALVSLDCLRYCHRLSSGPSADA